MIECLCVSMAKELSGIARWWRRSEFGSWCSSCIPAVVFHMWTHCLLRLQGTFQEASVLFGNLSLQQNGKTEAFVHYVEHSQQRFLVSLCSWFVISVNLWNQGLRQCRRVYSLSIASLCKRNLIWSCYRKGNDSRDSACTTFKLTVSPFFLFNSLSILDLKI